MQQYSEKTRQMINRIGSGETGYVAEAVACAVNTLDKIAADSKLDEQTRSEAAFAAANLLLSDVKGAKN